MLQAGPKGRMPSLHRAPSGCHHGAGRPQASSRPACSSSRWPRGLQRSLPTADLAVQSTRDGIPRETGAVALKSREFPQLPSPCRSQHPPSTTTRHRTPASDPPRNKARMAQRHTHLAPPRHQEAGKKKEVGLCQKEQKFPEHKVRAGRESRKVVAARQGGSATLAVLSPSLTSLWFHQTPEYAGCLGTGGEPQKASPQKQLLGGLRSCGAHFLRRENG